MPSESRTPIEPTIEELSAYLDHELDASAQERVAEHIAGCAECQARLDGLRQTAHAIQGLPMETPPRPFTIPTQARRQSWNWAPVGWIGGVAAAMLIIVVGVTHLPNRATTAGTASKAVVTAHQNAPAYSQGSGSGAASLQDRFKAFSSQGFSNESWIPGQEHSMRIGTDNTAYGPTGTIRARVIVNGSPSQIETSQQAGIQLLLVSSNSGTNGPGVTLPPLSGSFDSTGTGVFEGSYRVDQLGLSGNPTGPYRLIAIWTVPGASPQVLVAEVSIYVTRS